MNSTLLPLPVVAAVALLVTPQTSEATIYTFDVDASSGIGSGSFTIDLPNLWPANFGHVTVIPASSVRGFFARGDKWTALSVSLHEFLEQPSNAELSGGCKKAGVFTTATRGIGLTPVEAVDALPGITLRGLGVTQSELNRQRQSPWFEKGPLLIAGSRQSSRVASGLGSTGRLVESAALPRLRGGETARRRRRRSAIPVG